mgnify:CR=1 FL=1
MTASAFVLVVFMTARASLPGPAAALMTAHIVLETGFGKSTPGNNPGGVVATNSEPHVWVKMSRCRTVKCYKFIYTRVRLRAYSTLESGVRSMMRLIRRKARYRKAYALLRKGDPRYFHELASAGYCTAPPAVFAKRALHRYRLVRRMLRKAQKRLQWLDTNI